MMEGTVLRTRGGVYSLALDDETRVEASLRGRLKREQRTGDRVVIGDRVAVAQAADGGYTIEEVLPRQGEIVRRAPGGRRAKVVAANVDRLLAVIAAAEPDPSPELVDRLLLVAEANDLEAVLVVNKMDLDTGRDRGRHLAAAYRSIGYAVITTSAETAEGIDELREAICTGTSAMVGPSGGGKSSLLNAVEPDLDLRTGELSRKSMRGRHTTVSARLIELGCGGKVADTPGFSDVGLWEVEPEDLENYFPDFRPHLDACRFRGCAHLEEPDCAVKTAVEEGGILPDRYASYRRIREEAVASSAPSWKR